MPAADPVTGVSDAVTSAVDEFKQHEALKNAPDVRAAAVAEADEKVKEKIIKAVAAGDLQTIRNEVAE